MSSTVSDPTHTKPEPVHTGSLASKFRLPEAGELGLEAYRPGQAEAIREILGEFAAGKRVVLLEGPCGSGKSVIAMAVAKAIGKSALILTQTKQLSSQYCDLFPEIFPMRGRSNFVCNLDPNVTCDQGLCNMDKAVEAECRFSCPYYVQKEKARQALYVVTNIFYFLNEANYVGDFSGRDLLVIDEGHLLENAMMSFVSIEFSRAALNKVGMHLPRFRSIEEVVAWAEKSTPTVISALAKAKDAGDVKEYIRLAAYGQRMQRVTKEVKRVGDWILEETMTGIRLKPIWVSNYGYRNVFKHGQRILVMSATIRSPKQFCRCLGLEESEVAYIEMPSRFPVESRPVIYWPVAKVSGRHLRTSQDKLIRAIDDILGRHENHKGVIHTVSFSLAQAIMHGSKYKDRLLTHGPRDRELVIDEFLDSDGNIVLVSPSVEIGLDLYGDRARFQIIAKLPFGFLGDPQVKARMEQDPQWYSWNTACTLLQMCGRSTRSETDWSRVYIIDGNAGWFMKRYSYLFPEWWKESVYYKEGITEEGTM